MKLLKVAAKGIVIIWGIMIIVYWFLTYMVFKITPTGGQDGFGRDLVPAPFIAKYLVNADQMWNGWGWFFLESLVFFSSIFICIKIWGWADQQNDRNK